jgi:DNA-binding NarL/FixJ family response regulator
MADLRATLVVLDRHELVRKGLRTLFHSLPGLHVIGECATAQEAITQVTRFLPDVLVMSPVLPDASGFDTCRRIRARAPSVRVVMLVASADERAVVAGVRAGAMGVVSQRAPLSEICRAVRAAAAGTSLLDAPATAAILEHVRGRHAEPDGTGALTDLEHRVLSLVVDGLTNREIAHELAISEKTTKGHLSRAFAKLHATRRTQAAVLFISEGGAGRGGGRPEAA